jgi:hypothetical protein
MLNFDQHGDRHLYLDPTTGEPTNSGHRGERRRH